MLTFIDGLLNRITMYRLVLYYLIILLAAGAAFGAFGVLPYSPINIAFSTAFLTIACLIANGIFAKVYKAQANFESAYITALILALIITPVAVNDAGGIAFLFWAAVWAMASKYILAIHKKHLFNPAAFAVALTALTINQSASWWVGGNLPLLGFVLAGGLLVARKLQRFEMIGAFSVAAIATIIATTTFGSPLATAEKTVLHTSLLFFAFIMLTEPLTTPPTRFLRIAYGAVVGFLFAPALHLGPIYSTPELALVAGNVFSYVASPKRKYVFTLKEKNTVGADIYDFGFAADGPLRYRPGQYMEWTLSQDKADMRGNRRYFTLASSPTEPLVRLGVKFYDPSSTFKKKLAALEPGSTIVAGQLAGDFTLPSDYTQKLVFIAGGIGITPFRSMIKYLSDRNEHRDVILLYSNRTVSEIAYADVFDEATQKIGLKVLYAITDANEQLPEVFYRGRIDAALIERTVPDYRERMFFISGTHAMTTAFRKSLSEIGVPATHIKTDFFPGFV